jgi:hypothetical protein
MWALLPLRTQSRIPFPGTTLHAATADYSPGGSGGPLDRLRAERRFALGNLEARSAKGSAREQTASCPVKEEAYSKLPSEEITVTRHSLSSEAAS